MIEIQAESLLDTIDTRGWAKGTYQTADGRVDLFGAIRECSPQGGDAYLVEEVARRQGWGPRWNDAPTTSESDVRERLAAGIVVTDADLADTFGPRWESVVATVRAASRFTRAEYAEMSNVHVATVRSDPVAWFEARGRARLALWDASLGEQARAAFVAVTAVADAALSNDPASVRSLVWSVLEDVTQAVVLGDLVSIEDRHLLLGPWPAP